MSKGFSGGLTSVACALALGVFACRLGEGRTPSVRHLGPTVAEQADTKMIREYHAVAIGFGFKPPTHLPPGVEILRDKVAYQKAIKRDLLSDYLGDGKVSELNFERDVVVVFEGPDESGMDFRPLVNGVSREEKALTLILGFVELPNAEYLDVLRRPFLYFRLPKEAFAGDFEIELQVESASFR